MNKRITKPFSMGSGRRYSFLDRARIENPRYFSRVPLAAVTIIGLAVAVLLAIRATERRGITVAPVSEDPATSPPAESLKEIAEGRRKMLPSLFEGNLVDSKNGEDFRDTFGMRHLLTTLGHSAPEEVSRKSEQYTDYAGSVSEPDAFRGKWVRVRGLVASMKAVRLDSIIGAETDVFRGFLTQTDGSDAIAFDMPEPPPAFDLRRDVADIEGIFYRTVRYETQGSRWVEVPYLLVKNFRVIHAAASTASTGSRPRNIFLMIGAFVLGAAFVAYHRFRRRQSPRGGGGFAGAFAKKSAFPRGADAAQRPEPTPPNDVRAPV